MTLPAEASPRWRDMRQRGIAGRSVVFPDRSEAPALRSLKRLATPGAAKVTTPWARRCRAHRAREPHPDGLPPACWVARVFVTRAGAVASPRRSRTPGRGAGCGEPRGPPNRPPPTGLRSNEPLATPGAVNEPLIQRPGDSAPANAWFSIGAQARLSDWRPRSAWRPGRSPGARPQISPCSVDHLELRQPRAARRHLELDGAALVLAGAALVLADVPATGELLRLPGGGTHQQLCRQPSGRLRPHVSSPFTSCDADGAGPASGASRRWVDTSIPAAMVRTRSVTPPARIAASVSLETAAAAESRLSLPHTAKG